MIVNDLLIDKVVMCPVKYRPGYGKHVYFHKCIVCYLCVKHRIISEIHIFFIYLKSIVRISFEKLSEIISR